jgi:hypothetical protein
MHECSDQQIATEPSRRAGAMQLTPDQPQFGYRPIEQLANLAVDLGGVRTARSVASAVEATRNGRRLARELARPAGSKANETSRDGTAAAGIGD